MTQSEFLQSAMSELTMSRDAFAVPLGRPRWALDKWLLPQSSNDHRAMSEVVWTLVREILAHEKLKIKVGTLEKAYASSLRCPHWRCGRMLIDDSLRKN